MKHCLVCILEYESECFCTDCGNELSDGKLPAALERQKGLDRCRTCGRLFRDHERFCGGCGLPFGKATAGAVRLYLEEDSSDEEVPA